MFARFLPRLVAALAVIAGAIAFAWLTPLDAQEHGGLLRLVGRMHPLLIHFPVVLLLLVPALEWFGRRRPALREAAGCLLGLAVPCCLLAVMAGLALARADGHEGELLRDHRLGGVLVTGATALAWSLRGRTGYGVALLGAIAALIWTAHNGGSLTHGADYLTGPLPAGLKRLLHLKEVPPPESYAPDTVFGAAVRPVLEKHCFSCHGPEKQKGDYRMDTFAALLAGGKSGHAAIIPRDLLNSELARRLALKSGDEKVMPPKRKPRPTAAEIALLRWWIKQGASRDLKLADVKDAPREVAALLAAGVAPAGESGEPAYVPRVGDYSALQGEIAGLEKSLGVRLVPVSLRAGDGLILRVRGAEARFGDAELAQLARVAPFVVEAELADTRVTDAGFASLKRFTHLERLHLERTAVSGSALGELRALARLQYLNLCATAVTDEALAKLAPHPGLRQVYLFGSRVTAEGVTRLQPQLPQVNFGPVDDVKPAAAPAGG